MIKREIYDRIGINILQKAKESCGCRYFREGILKEGVIELTLEEQGIRKRWKESESSLLLLRSKTQRQKETNKACS